MRFLRVLVGLGLGLGLAVEVSAQDLTYLEKEAISYQREARLLGMEYEESEAFANELWAVIPQHDQSYECNAILAAVAQGVAIRSGGTNMVADAIGAYCAGAELFSWLRGWQLRALDRMGWISIAMDLNWSWKYGGPWWQYWV